MSLVADPWVWVALAAGLGLLELVLPGYLLLGFSLSALAFAGAFAVAPGMAPTGPQGALVAAALWAALALALWLGLSRAIKANARSRQAGPDDINDFDNRS